MPQREPDGEVASPGSGADSQLRKLAGDCVHCGFCLPACPTYQLWGEEMDSPRGRIHLITQLLDGTGGGASAALHLDRCLGCMACVTACPSGVRYDRLIEAARSWAAEPAAGTPRPAPGPGPAPERDLEPAPDPAPEPRPARAPDLARAPASRPGPAGAGGRRLPPRPRRERLVRAAIFSLFPYPRRLRAALVPLRAAQRLGLDQAVRGSAAAHLLPAELAAAIRLAPAPPRSPGGHAGPAAAPAQRLPAHGQRRAIAGLLTGCVQSVLYPEVNAATAQVLAAEGCDVVIPPGQGCCGALSLHGGRTAEAKILARRTVAAFERAGVDAVVVNVAGCGSAMKDYADLLAGDPAWAGRAAALAARVRDFSEFLADLGPVAPRYPLPLTAAYHDACHLEHAQRVTAQPRQLLAAIPGLRLAEIAGAGTCCGSAGIYNLVQPGPARELGRRKAAAVAATAADILVSGNPGCALQISSALADQGSPMPMVHIAQVLHASIRGTGASALGA